MQFIVLPGVKNFPFRKSILIMKISVILLLLALHVSAKNYGQQTINMSEKNITIEEVLKRIERQSDYRFFYSNDILSKRNLISINVANAPIQRVMLELFEGTNLVWKLLKNKNIVIAEVEKTNTEPQALQKVISGVVTDENGEAIEGATIQVKGTNTGTVTGRNGHFTINANTGDVLVISSVGYSAQEIIVSAEENLQIILRHSASDLSEVVVIGYGSQKKSDLTGSVASISQRNMKDLPVTGFDQALKGQAAGVQVTQNTGSPSSGLTIRIRGNSSISAGNDPLYVIDGFPVSGGNRGTEGVPSGGNPLNNINPADIESIDILKDASATSIYGSRGANGVIIVTTKSGKAGKGTLTFNSYVGLQKITKMLQVLNASQFADYFIEARNNGFIQSGGDPSTPNASRGAYTIPAIYLDSTKWNETNWQDEIYRTGFVQNYNLLAIGGNNNVKYSVSGGYLQNEAIIIETALKRYSFRANLDANLSKKLKVGVRFSPSYTINNEVNSDGFFNAAIVNMAMRLPPLIGPFQPDGTYTNILAMRNVNQLGSIGVVDNPIAKAREDQYDLTQGRVLGNGFLEYKITNNLTFHTSIGVDANFNTIHRFLSSKTGRASVAPPNIPSGNAQSSQEIEWLNENLLTYDKVFNKMHHLNAIAGFSAQKDDYRVISVAGINYPNDNVQYVSAAGTISSGSENRNQFSLVSYFTRWNYSFKEKYLITATVRTDGSSRFGEDKKYGFFPSGALAWRMSEEKFMKPLEFISNLKWRFSYGISGNNNIGNYNFVPNMVNTTYVLGTTPAIANAISTGRLANPLITWETKHTSDLGLDVGLFDNRLQLTADVYNSITDGLLLNVNIPAVSGFSTSLVNIGKVQNKGLELTITGRPFVGEFNWSPSFNISLNRNKVLALGGSETDFILSGNSKTVIGKPMGLFYGRVTDGIFQSAAEIAASPPQDNTPRPGDRKFKDINRDGKVDNNDLDFIGDPNPKFTFGFTNSFSYKNFDLSILTNGTYGNNIYYNYGVGANLAGNLNQDIVVLNRWRSPSQPGNGKVPRNVFGFTTLSDTPSDFFIFDGSYFRIANITLGYTFGRNLLTRMRMQALRIYLGAQNVMTITKYPGYDPEIASSGGNPLQIGVDAGIYPLAKIFLVGINISF